MRKRKSVSAAAILAVTVLACLLLWGWGVAVMTAPAVDAAAPELPCIDRTALVEAAKAVQADPYDESIPLDRELQATLREACEANNVPLSLALGLIEEESHFQPDAVSSKGAYGLCQLNPKYFPTDLTPAENITAGVAWLGELLEQYEDTAEALRAYNLGYDDGDRQFADTVLAATEKWNSY